MTSYQNLVHNVQLLGHPHTARGLTTRELLGGQLTHIAGHIAGRRGLNTALGYMELCQLIAGVFDRKALARVAPKARLDLFTKQAAYGPRIYKSPDEDQLEDALYELGHSPGSRRAMIYMATPDEENPLRPCTNSIQFLVRDGLVHTVVSMRSWDLYLGAPYDLIMFGGLNMLVAQVLGHQPGNVTVSAGSAHIYLENSRNRGWAVPSTRRFEYDPEFTTLEDFRLWATLTVEERSWVSGAPLGITEYDI